MKERPIIDELEPLYSDKIVFIHVNSSRNPEAMKEFAVNGFPAMFLIYGKSGDGYSYRDLSGFKEKLFLQDAFDMVANGDLSTLNLSSLGDEDFGNSSCFPHHSCSFSKCLKNCLKDAASDFSFGKVLFELGDLLKTSIDRGNHPVHPHRFARGFHIKTRKNNVQEQKQNSLNQRPNTHRLYRVYPNLSSYLAPDSS